MDDGPNEETPNSWGEVRLLHVFVDGMWGGHGVDVRPQEEEISGDVDGFEIFSPARAIHFGRPSLGWGGTASSWR